MRSHLFVKMKKSRSLLILLTLSIAVNADAGFFKKVMSAARIKSTSAKNNSINSANASLEKKFIQPVFAGIDLNVAQNSILMRDLALAVKWKVEKKNEVSTATHTDIFAEYSETGLVMHYQYDEMALENPANIVKDLAVISGLSAFRGLEDLRSDFFGGLMKHQLQKDIRSIHSIAELIMNARAGSPTAQLRWLQTQIALLEVMNIRPKFLTVAPVSSEILGELISDLKNEISVIQGNAGKYARDQQKTFDAWKKNTGALDKLEAMDLKLDDLILNNDRQGVRRLVETYLPWTLMEPAETKAWKIWLDAIENPDLTNTTVAFRGLSFETDKLQRQSTADGEKIGLMSTVLTQNQGSYTRRLRSLLTNRKSNGDYGFNKNNESFDLLTVKICDQMVSHAAAPRASNFISFTFNPVIAKAFVGKDVVKKVNGKEAKIPFGGMIAVKMDSRRLIPNLTSEFGHEVELLAPLIVFPDEIVSFHEGQFEDRLSFQAFIAEVSEITGIDYSTWAENRDATDIDQRSLKEKYREQGYQFMRKITSNLGGTKQCSSIFAEATL